MKKSETKKAEPKFKFLYSTDSYPGGMRDGDDNGDVDGGDVDDDDFLEFDEKILG